MISLLVHFLVWCCVKHDALGLRGIRGIRTICEQYAAELVTNRADSIVLCVCLIVFLQSSCFISADHNIALITQLVLP